MRAAVLLALLLPGFAGPAAAQVVEQGERVDVEAAEFPPLVVADRPFYINVTVRNRESQPHTVLLFATLYLGSGAPCEGRRAADSVSRFQKSVALGPGAREVVEGAPSHWAQVVNGSRLPSDGAYEVCVWARLADCPEAPLTACFLDFHPVRQEVRLRNLPPDVSLRVVPARGTTATGFEFRADGADPDGDPWAARWDFADGRTGEGARVTHRFLAAGTYTVRLNATDGFDGVDLEARVEVAPSGAAARPAPMEGALLAALALGAGAARARPRP